MHVFIQTFANMIAQAFARFRAKFAKMVSQCFAKDSQAFASDCHVVSQAFANFRKDSQMDFRKDSQVQKSWFFARICNVHFADG